MRFSKWQGIGNDYILVREEDIPLAWRDSEHGDRFSAEAAEALCDRHFGIGGDGILVLGRARGHADARMLVHNPDGSMAEMCGNGVRMAARYLTERGTVPSPRFELEIVTGGTVTPEVLEDGRVRVDMGEARTSQRFTVVTDHGAVEGRTVDMGNPHFVVEQDPEVVALEQLGPGVEHDTRFPNRTNVEFFRVDGPGEVTMRVWERGVGETLACGSGACAVGVVAVRDAGVATPLVVHLEGGDLEIDLDASGRVWMTGPADLVYEGSLDDDAFDFVEVEQRELASS